MAADERRWVSWARDLAEALTDGELAVSKRTDSGFRWLHFRGIPRTQIVLPVGTGALRLGPGIWLLDAGALPF